MKEVNHQNFGMKLFSEYVADPSAASLAEPEELQIALEKFPYCQLLHLFYSRSLAAKGSSENADHLARTTIIIPDRTILYSVIRDPEKLNTTSSKLKDFIDSPDSSEKSESEAGQVAEEIKAESDRSVQVEPQATTKGTAVSKPATNDSDLIENIFNQLIGAIPPPVTPVAVHAVTTPFIDEDFISEPENMTPADSTPPQEESPAVGKEESIETKAEEEVEIKTKDSETDQKVSKYDDDKMPYSFLWWLNKTRNEHSDTYQPYVDFKLDTTQTIKRTSVDQLSSQIIENIFHLQSPLEEIENAPKTVPFQVRRKEDLILDKFIKEEPQIRPPNSQKLDTENKARKSAEDPNDLVSETLAQIYTDQMLFQKAIDTFKKLSLKFPEKSTYFADQIIELEKKVN